MDKLIDKLKTTGLLLYNKGVALLALLLLMASYLGQSDSPFLEFLYAGVMIGIIAVGGPLFRLLVFPYAAEMAETGDLRGRLKGLSFTPSIVHYWIATVVSYTVVILCITALL